MRLKNICVALLVISMFACNSSDDNNRVTPESTTYEFFENAEMTLVTNQGIETLEIEPGTNTVFKYFFKDDDNLDISDDEYAESIYFKVDGSLDSFNYSDTANAMEFRDLSLFIKRACFCANTGAVFPTVGSVSGTKLSNGNWDVSISITFQWEGESEMNTRNISGTFVPATTN